MGLLEYIGECGVDPASGGRLVAEDGRCVEVAVDPQPLERTVAGEESLLVIHTREASSSMSFDVAPDGVLRLTEVFLAGGRSGCAVRQQGRGCCEITCVAAAPAVAEYTVDLDGCHAENILRGAFIAGGDDRAKIGVRVNHNAADCRSDSLVKGVAGGDAVGEFAGMVYVAPDAQRTDARQTSRNIVLGDGARIVTEPQLEIYADDVKCSHGATVGQLDGEAVMYMRQRGLSEAQARRLQIEGFVRDVVGAGDGIAAALAEVLTSKLETL